MRMRWLLLLAAAAVVASAALVDAGVSGAKSLDVSPTTNVYAWIGLKNSDDVGTSFDVQAEVTNGSSEGYGTTSVPVSGISSGFNRAHLVQIPITNYVGNAGQPVSVTISVRVACTSKHTSGTARLWWNDSAANSKVNESPGFGDLYLTGANTLSPNAGTGPKMTKDLFVKKNGCPGGTGAWQTFGTWTNIDQLLCESLGGGYAGPDIWGDLWSCSNVPYADNNEFSVKFDALFTQCYIVEGNIHNFSTTGVTLNFQCRPR